MKEELEKRLLESLHSVQDFISQTGDLAVKEAPIIIEQLISYHFWWSGLLAALGLLMMCAFPLAIFATEAFRLSYMEWETIGSVGFLASFLGLALFLWAISDFIMVTVAPKLFVLEYVRGIL